MKNKRKSRDITLHDQMYAIQARCSTSPKLMQKDRDKDAEPRRCVIDAHELPSMNMSYYP